MIVNAAQTLQGYTLTAPLILNRYRLLETKGKGGFGTVDVAWDNRLQRRVAIKRIPLSNEQTVIPGIQEARTAALLNEPHIVSVLDFEVTSSEALLIMENVDGPTLSDLLEESTELLDLDTIAAIITDVAAALEYAHENQVLHLDIKPDNILIDHKGNVKVTDVGLSELSGTVGFSEPQGGTIGYMPPEQIEQKDIDGRTDLWALAVLLYLMLTGINPFHAKNSTESLKLIFNEPLPLPSALHDDLDPGADEIIIKALMALKEERFSGVLEFSEAIMPFLGSAQKGQRNLKVLVNERDLDEVEFTDRWHQEQLPYEEEGELLRPAAVTAWDRVPALLKGFFARLVAAAACGGITYLGLSGFDLMLQGLQGTMAPIITIAVVALIALGAFLVPQLGSGLAAIVLVSGLFARGLFFLGAGLAVVLVIWWALFGRRSAVESTLVMLTPLSGALMLSFALPLLSGYLLPWRRALVTTFVQTLILIAVAAATLSDSLIRTKLLLPTYATTDLTGSLSAFILNPEPWIYFVAFLLATLIMTLFMDNYTLLRAIGGLLVSVGVIFMTCFLVPYLIGFDIYPLETVVGLILSFILVLILLLLGISANVEQTEEV
jgi:hypothetical protein